MIHFFHFLYSTYIKNYSGRVSGARCAPIVNLINTFRCEKLQAKVRQIEFTGVVRLHSLTKVDDSNLNTK